MFNFEFNLSKLLVVFIGLAKVKSQVDLEEYFGNCKIGSTDFDDCLKDGINGLRPYFAEGLPEYGVEPFDPFFAPEVHQKMSNPLFNYKLVLRNVTESGWSSSQVTKFRMDASKSTCHVTQFFPDKRLNGWYEIEGTFFGQKVKNQGSWNLELYDYVQTLSVSKKAARSSNGKFLKDPPVKVKCALQSCKNLKLHIGNLAGGRTIVENMLDWVINTAWQPGFYVLSPLINDLVGTAFTDIFNKNFQYFPFESIFHK